MVKRINFFATKNDMVSVLSEMEEQLPFGIKYIQCGKTDSILYSTVTIQHETIIDILL